jgi:hypothetical protein
VTTRAYINGYEPVAFTDFSGGLNLRDKSDAVGDKEAIDLLNVTFADRGAIYQRDGYHLFTQSPLSELPNSMSEFYTAAGLRQLVVGTDEGSLIALSSSGIPVSSTGALAGTPFSFARFAAPGLEYLYAANGIDTTRRWDGVTWTTGAVTATVDGIPGRAMPRAGAICVTGAAPGLSSSTNANNRMIATAFGTQTNGGPGGAATNPSRVYFSNKGDPETWETDGALVPAGAGTEPYQRGENWIDLTPGDGEMITGAVSWRELTLIFKQTKFFVIWGESENPKDSTPVLQYREVVNQAGLVSRLALSSGRDGVYFFNRRGVYVTTGGPPNLLSDIISPLWTQDPEVYYKGDPINFGALDRVRMQWHMERLFLSVPTGTRVRNDCMPVYDVQHQWWSMFDCGATCMASYRPDTFPSLYFGSPEGEVEYLQPGATSDHDGPITSRWRSGFGDYNSSQQKTIRETKVWGTGVVNVAFSVDFNELQRANVTVTLGLRGQWPIVGQGTWNVWLDGLNDRWPQSNQVSNNLVRYARRGTLFSTEFSNSPQSPSWSVHRVASHLREIREPSIR